MLITPSVPLVTSTPSTPPAGLSVDTAGVLCEKTVAASLAAEMEAAETSLLSLPILALINREYDSSRWEVEPSVAVAGVASTAATSVMCIRERRQRTGQYPDNSAAYQRVWDVWLLSWPEGNSLASRSFQGSLPPERKWNPCQMCAGYGSAPLSDVSAWVESLMAADAVE